MPDGPFGAVGRFVAGPQCFPPHGKIRQQCAFFLHGKAGARPPGEGLEGDRVMVWALILFALFAVLLFVALDVIRPAFGNGKR